MWNITSYVISFLSNAELLPLTCLSFSLVYKVFPCLRLPLAGHIITQIAEWPGLRAVSGARPTSQTWWSSKTKSRMTIWSQFCQTKRKVHIIGSESLKAIRMKLGPGLGITARGLVSIHGQKTSPTTTTGHSFAWRSTWIMKKTEGSGMMIIVPQKNSLFVTRVRKTDHVYRLFQF